VRIIKFRGKVQGNWWHVDSENDAWEQFWALVERETVGQYIGLNDAMGTEIYEHDIIKVYDNIRVVEYKRAWWNALTPEEFYQTSDGEPQPQLPGGFGVMQGVTQDDEGQFKPMYRHAEYALVVGNVHDNPELLHR